VIVISNDDLQMAFHLGLLLFFVIFSFWFVVDVLGFKDWK